MTAFRGKSRATAVHSNKGISSRSIPRQITKTLVTGSAIGLIAMNSQAIDYSFNQVSGSVDTKVSWGSIFRTEGQELDVTGLVLLSAVVLDSFSRRRQQQSGIA